jgi:hypothetical protein
VFILTATTEKKVTGVMPLQVYYRIYFSGFGGLVVSMLASGTQVRGLKPG